MNSIIIDNEVNSLPVRQLGQGLQPPAAAASLNFFSTSAAVPIKANGRARAFWLG